MVNKFKQLVAKSKKVSRKVKKLVTKSNKLFKKSKKKVNKIKKSVNQSNKLVKKLKKLVNKSQQVGQTIRKIVKRPKGFNIFVKSNLKVNKKDIGLSVACDGVCLTLISYKSQLMEFYLSKETIIRSKFKYLKNNDIINLELPLKYGTKISGHICQGHVDTVAKVLSIKKIDKSFIFDFEISKKDRKHLIEKASICVNGISLTISKKTAKGFQVWIIPHSLKLTNLSKIKKNDLVNIEIDILSKYVRNYFNEK